MIETIILDGDLHSALAATRSLGKRGLKVAVGSDVLPSLASRSRYCAEAFQYPSPSLEPQKFLAALREYAERHRGCVLLPMRDITLEEVLRNAEAFRGMVKVPFAEHAIYSAASDKAYVLRLAKKLGVPAPATLFPADFSGTEELIREASKLGYPLVIKPCRSRFRAGGIWHSTHVRYASGEIELREILNESAFGASSFVLQERIEGEGTGIFLLMNGGQVLGRFAHRRIREKPPSGGVSVLCESIGMPDRAFGHAAELLRALDWSGVAMVEFKMDKRDNLAKLMEINARFWGSLELAISAGVDFPFLLYRLAVEGKADPPPDYRIGIKSRWELGDLDHLLIRMKKKNNELFLPAGAPTKFGVVKDFVLDYFRPSIRNEVLRLDDPGPFLFELGQYIKELFRKLYSGK